MRAAPFTTLVDEEFCPIGNLTELRFESGRLSHKAFVRHLPDMDFCLNGRRILRAYSNSYFPVVTQASDILGSFFSIYIPVVALRLESSIADLCRFVTRAEITVITLQGPGQMRDPLGWTGL